MISLIRRSRAKWAAKIVRKTVFEAQKTGSQQQIKDLLRSDPGYALCKYLQMWCELHV